MSTAPPDVKEDPYVSRVVLDRGMETRFEVDPPSSNGEPNEPDGSPPTDDPPAGLSTAPPDQPTPAQFFSVHARLTGDAPVRRDALDYQRYADVIARFLCDPATGGRVSVSIQAPWGAGKSSLMRIIQSKLDPGLTAVPAAGDRLTIADVIDFLDKKAVATPGSGGGAIADSERWTVWFNAWKYENSEQVWAGLVDAIITQVSARLGPVQRELFLLRLNLSRVDDTVVRRRIYDRVANLWWGRARRFLITGGAISLLPLLGVPALGALLPFLLPHPIEAGLGASGLGYVLTILYGFRKHGEARAEVKAEPAEFSLAEYIRVPDYAKSVGIVHEIHRDLERVLAVLPKWTNPETMREEPRPLVVFIDDLDRCAPDKVAKVVEGVNMFLASDLYQCLFVIGMDPQVVAAALDCAHKDVRDRLPAYERTVPLGWRFMDKFIQLPFTIPRPTQEKVGDYLGTLLQSRKVQIHRGQESAPIPVTAVESPDVRAIMTHIVGFCANPRELKRYLNLTRFYLTLRSAAPGPLVPVEVLARWIELTLRWPDMLRWLLWSPSRSLRDGGVVEFRPVGVRLQVLTEHAAETAHAPWRDKVAAELGLDPTATPWLDDPELYKFFHRERALEPAQAALAQVAHAHLY